MAPDAASEFFKGNKIDFNILKKNLEDVVFRRVDIQWGKNPRGTPHPWDSAPPPLGNPLLATPRNSKHKEVSWSLNP